MSMHLGEGLLFLISHSAVAAVFVGLAKKTFANGRLAAAATSHTLW